MISSVIAKLSTALLAHSLVIVGASSVLLASDELDETRTQVESRILYAASTFTTTIGPYPSGGLPGIGVACQYYVGTKTISSGNAVSVSACVCIDALGLITEPHHDMISVTAPAYYQ